MRVSDLPTYARDVARRSHPRPSTRRRRPRQASRAKRRPAGLPVDVVLELVRRVTDVASHFYMQSGADARRLTTGVALARLLAMAAAARFTGTTVATTAETFGCHPSLVSRALSRAFRAEGVRGQGYDPLAAKLWCELSQLCRLERAARRRRQGRSHAAGSR